MKSIALEVIALNVADAVAAESGGADRIELIDDLSVGGITPSPKTIRDVKRAVGIPVYVMIRSRGGGFVYAESEIEIMVRQAQAAQGAGADGIVLGILRGDATIDFDAVTRVVEAGGLPVTFHKAFDQLSPEIMRHSLMQLSDIPLIERVLTAGGYGDAFAGRHVIANLVGCNRLSIMPGGGVTLANVTRLVNDTGVREVHVGTAVRQRSALDGATGRRPHEHNALNAPHGQHGPNAPNGTNGTNTKVSEALVAELRQLLRTIS